MTIIDNTLPEFEDAPATLNGEVLLERPAAGGFITCTVETSHWLKQGNAAQRTSKGHGQYEATHQATDTSGAVLPTVEQYAIDLLAMGNDLLGGTRLESWATVLQIFAESKLYQGAGFPADTDPFPRVQAESDATLREPQQAALHFATSVPQMKARLAAAGNAGNINAAMAISHDWLDNITDLLSLE
jgi:hypothetical protein